MILNKIPFSAARSGILAAAVLLAVGINEVSAQTVTYDVRASTRDRIRAVTGGAKQGSFGAPSINNKGAVAYACILTGQNTSAFTSNSILYRRKGRRSSVETAIQAGVFLDPSPIVPTIFDPYVFQYFTSSDPDLSPALALALRISAAQVPTPYLDYAFLPTFSDSLTFPDYTSGRFFRVGRDVALNDKLQISFNGELLFSRVSVALDDSGNVSSVSRDRESRAVFGLTYRKSGRFFNAGMVTFVNFFEGILSRTMSVEKRGFLPFNADFILTPDKTVPGFAYVGPVDVSAEVDTFVPFGDPPRAEKAFNGSVASTESLVATTESNVIGLSYFTTFDSFSDAIIADNNRMFVVADISDDGDEFDGIWQGNNPNLQPVIVKDIAAPGGGDFATFDDIIGPSRNGNLVSCIANVTGDARRGVYRSTRVGEELTRIAAVGDNAPGFAGQGSLGEFADFSLVATNNRGAVALLGTYSNADGTGDREGIWITNRKTGQLQLVATEGQTVEINGREKRINRLAFNPISGLNNKGQIAFTASFNDRTSSVIIAEVK